MSENYTKEIEDAAHQYTKEVDNTNEWNDLFTSFIAGVNSNIATKIKLEFAIEQLKELKEGFNTFNNLMYKIIELEQQLKELKL